MKCALCKTGVVSVIVAAQVDGRQVMLKLCAACAKQQPVPCTKSLSVSFGRSGRPLRRKRPGGRCPHCGCTWRDFREYRFVGCAACYRSLGPSLARHLRSLYGGARHRGRWPQRLKLMRSEPLQTGDLFSEIIAAVKSGNEAQIRGLRVRGQRTDENG